ncbi:hypothetical protein [Paenibacillus puerhi]|uniref:hypothetical protein n=1 Tax=Paenibacillus puerhi TaxID=2692622 RepID=UPI00135CAB6A|nr:hypothetical protein [Paenibacillus puerhi]
MSMVKTSCQRPQTPTMQLKEALTEERKKLEEWFAVRRNRNTSAESVRALDERLLQIDSALTRIRMRKHISVDAYDRSVDEQGGR